MVNLWTLGLGSIFKLRGDRSLYVKGPIRGDAKVEVDQVGWQDEVDGRAYFIGKPTRLIFGLDETVMEFTLVSNDWLARTENAAIDAEDALMDEEPTKVAGAIRELRRLLTQASFGTRKARTR